MLPDWPESVQSRRVQYCFRVICEPVPIFVFVDGYLRFRSHYNPRKHLKRCVVLFALLMFWSSVLILSGLYQNGEKITPNLFFTQLFDTSLGNPYNGVLWFLINLIALYLVFPVLKLIMDKDKKVFCILFWTAFFFTIFLNFFGLLADFIEIYHSVALFRKFLRLLYRFDPFGNQIFLFYFLLGGIVYLRDKDILEKRLGFILGGIIGISAAMFFGLFISIKKNVVYNAGYNYSQPFLTLMILGMFALFVPRKGRLKYASKAVSLIGSSTFGIYVFHYIFVIVAKRFFTYLFFTERLKAVCFVFACSCLCCAVFSYVPWLRPLIRKKPKKKINNRIPSLRV